MIGDRKIIVFVFVSCLLWAQTSFAEEEVGFVKRMWRKATGIFKKAPEEEKAPGKEKVMLPTLQPQLELEPMPESEIIPEFEPLPVPVPEPESATETEVKPETGGEYTTTKSPYDEITEEEMVSRIKHILEVEPGIPGYAPAIRVIRDEAKKVVKVEYNIDGVFRNIETLDKKTLIQVNNQINNARTIIQTERIHRQLQSINAAQQRQQQMPPMPPNIPKPPGPPPGPPQIPKPPPAPPQAPRR